MTKKVTVSLRATIQRINRKLKPDLQSVKTARGERLRQEVGDYYIIDYDRNYVADKDIDPEAYARELGVLQPWETVA